jgi:hypothetical protein
MKLAVISAVLALSFLDCEDCHDDNRFAAAFKEAIVYPERFQAYAQQHQAEFNQTFFSCNDAAISRMVKEIQKQEDFCWEQWGEDTDFRNGCLNDIQPLRVYHNDAIQLRSILTNQTPYESTDLYAILNAEKAADPDFHVQANGGLIDGKPMQSMLVCEECKKSFLGL